MRQANVEDDEVVDLLHGHWTVANLAGVDVDYESAPSGFRVIEAINEADARQRIDDLIVELDTCEVADIDVAGSEWVQRRLKELGYAEPGVRRQRQNVL